MKYVIQYLMALVFLILSTLVSLYEGSTIRDDSYEWKYTAFFSKMFNGEINDSADISQLDHLIYAAKFNPGFPILMICSLSYLLMLTLYIVLRKNIKILSISYLAIGMLYLLLGFLISDSPTIGGKYITFVLTTIGILIFIISLLFFIKVKKGSKGIRNNGTLLS